MTHVSRPLIGLLLATVVLFALWTVALKPRGSSGGAGGSGNQGLGQYQADINAAHRAVGTANAASARAGAVPARTTAARASAAAHLLRKPAETRLASVEHALRSHRVVALLFYNPGAPDDRAVHQELAGVPIHGGRVFKLAIPVGEIRSYTSITEQLSVNLSPTLVLVAPDRQTDEIVGYADPFEISQRVDDALALR